MSKILVGGSQERSQIKREIEDAVRSTLDVLDELEMNSEEDEDTLMQTDETTTPCPSLSPKDPILTVSGICQVQKRNTSGREGITVLPHSRRRSSIFLKSTFTAMQTLLICEKITRPSETTRVEPEVCFNVLRKELLEHGSVDGSFSMDFSDPRATTELTKVLLKEYYDLEWDLPAGQLVPPVTCRAKYIVWINDLLHLVDDLRMWLSVEAFDEGCCVEMPVRGLDIGCGANCIYPLMGASMYGWRFVGSDITDIAVSHACSLLCKNPNIQDHIEIVKIPEGAQEILVPVVQSHGPFHFCMCNPPFFPDIEEAGLNEKTAFGGTLAEMVCPGTRSKEIWPHCARLAGGELAFVEKMVTESIQLEGQICWYSAMLGKKSTFKKVCTLRQHARFNDMCFACQIRLRLYSVGVAALRTTMFKQGKTARWAIAWSFIAKDTNHKPLKSVIPPHCNPIQTLPVPSTLSSKCKEMRLESRKVIGRALCLLRETPPSAQRLDHHASQPSLPPNLSPRSFIDP